MNIQINMTRLFPLFLVTVWLFVTCEVSAQRFPFGRSQATEQNIELTDKAGPWLIMVASFSGVDGEQQANRLANELRTQHKLKAYTHSQFFKFEVATKGKGHRAVALSNFEQTVIPKSMKPANPDEFLEYAVLVGDFSSVEDPAAQKTLEKIKLLEPESMTQIKLEEAFKEEELAGARLQAWRTWSDMQVGRTVLPLRAAFVMANPLLPEEFFEARRFDKTILDLNSGLKYSLLNCPGAYSVRVATFTGSSTMDPQVMEQIKKEEQRKRRFKQSISDSDSKLADAAKRATLLTIELRRQGYEAYEFHDRFESYVCVGSFDWLHEEDRYGQHCINPEIEKTILLFKGQEVANQMDRNSTMMTGKTFPLPAKFLEAGIACDMQPLPVLVPKREGTRFASKLLERFR